MKNKKALLLSTLVLFGAQAYADNPAAVATEPTNTAAQCPSPNFKVFLKAFLNDINLQKAFTHLAYTKQVVFPVISNTKDLKAQGMQLKVTQSKNKATVVLFKPNTDIWVVYHFQKKTCWQLVRVEDQSG